MSYARVPARSSSMQRFGAIPRPFEQAQELPSSDHGVLLMLQVPGVTDALIVILAECMVAWDSKGYLSNQQIEQTAQQ